MASCRTCGDQLPDAARFCSACGTASGESVELIGSAIGPATETAVRAGGWRTRIYAAAAICAAGLLGWSMLSAPDVNDERLSELTEGERSSDSDDDVNDSETDDPEPARPNGGATTSLTGTTRRTTTEAEPDGAGPVLGETVGMSVFFGSDNAKLRRMDLDTGEIDEFDVRAMPLYIDGEWLVLWRSNTGSLDVVNIDDPAGESRSLGQAAFFGHSGSVVAGPQSGQLWARGPDFEEPVWQLFDLASGEVVRTVPGVVTYFGPTSGGPMVSSAPGGGVFELRGDDYVEVAAGQLMASSDDYALVQTCSDPVTCELGWLSRDGWRPIERSTPSEQVYAGWLTSDGRLLSYYGPRGLRVFDVVNGSYLTGFADQGDGIDISPDSRFAVSFANRLRFHSLDTGENFEADGVWGAGWGSAVFVENR